MSINLEVKLKDGESIDRLIKRFVKKTKKQEIIQEYLLKVAFYKTKSQKSRDKSAKNKYLREKNKL